MKTVAPGSSDSGENSANHNPPENRFRNRLNEEDGLLLKSPRAIRGFLAQRMADCLPQIGVMGQHYSAGVCSIEALQPEPSQSEGLQEISLAEVMGC